MIRFVGSGGKKGPKEKEKLKQWITKTIESHQQKAGGIDFVFCSDEQLLEINQQFLNHNTLTDIITFDYSEGMQPRTISGEIYISTERVSENAKEIGRAHV